MKLGDLARDGDELKLAEDYYNQSVAASEASKGTEFPYFLLEALNKLGELYRQQGSDEEAERVFRRARELQENAAGPKHPDLAASPMLTFLLNLYRDQHRLSDTNPDFEPAINLAKQTLGPENLKLVPHLVTYASVKQEERGLQESESLYRRALAIQEQNLPPSDTRLLGTLEGYASVLEALQKKDEAAALRARTQAIRRQAEKPVRP